GTKMSQLPKTKLPEKFRADLDFSETWKFPSGFERMCESRSRRDGMLFPLAYRWVMPVRRLSAPSQVSHDDTREESGSPSDRTSCCDGSPSKRFRTCSQNFAGLAS